METLIATSIMMMNTEHIVASLLYLSIFIYIYISHSPSFSSSPFLLFLLTVRHSLSLSPSLLSLISLTANTTGVQHKCINATSCPIASKCITRLGVERCRCRAGFKLVNNLCVGEYNRCTPMLRGRA